MDTKKYSIICKALGDETRIKIFDMLKEKEMCACQILENFNITQPTLSYHMKSLVASNLIDVRKDGIWTYYSVNKEMLNSLVSFLNK